MAERMQRARQLTATVGLAAVLMIGTAACSNDSSDDLPPPASPDSGPAATTPAETLDPRDAEAWEEIQTLFDGLMGTWIQLAAEGVPPESEPDIGARLAEYADGFLFGDVNAEIAQELNAGHLRTGRPTWQGARLLELYWENTVQDLVVPEAVFDVCVDDSDWLVVDADTGEPVGIEPKGPHLWTVTAAWVEERDFRPDGWALSEIEADEEQTC